MIKYRKMSFLCEYCNNSYTTKNHLTRHQNTEKCQYIKKLLEKKDKMYLEKINILEEINKTHIKKLEENYNIINKHVLQIEEQNKEIKMLKEKCNEYRIIVENFSTKSINFKNNKKENINNDTMFQIDININNKQLNKTKYKDIPENIIKNEIQSLKLKDNYQLEYRDTDGYINITNLCKAGGKQFKHWNSIDKTKKFLDVLSREVGIPTSELVKVGTGSKYEKDINNLTWSHPQVAINIAQWISPEFDVLVSKWVYEIMLTGKVDIRDNKTTQELDIINKENKLLKNRIKLLESKVLQKQPRETFDNSKNVIYIVTTEYKEAQGHYKIGKTQDLQKRLSTYNTTDKHEVIYYTSCGDKETMDILEKLIHKKLNSKRVEPNKEWFESEDDGEDLIKIIEDCKKILCE
jgi:hypothetical protein